MLIFLEKTGCQGHLFSNMSKIKGRLVEITSVLLKGLFMLKAKKINKIKFRFIYLGEWPRHLRSLKRHINIITDAF